jgi:hypothetical protein
LGGAVPIVPRGVDEAGQRQQAQDRRRQITIGLARRAAPAPPVVC